MELITMENLFKRVGLDYNNMEINKLYDISDMNVKIKSYNHDKKTNEMKMIIGLIRKEDSVVYELVTRSGDVLLRCSGGHRIFDNVSKTYVSVADIECGTAMSSSGESIFFLVKNTGVKEVIVDMHVCDNENYFTNGVLSHNTGGEALKFYSSIRIEMSRSGFLKDSSGDVFGIRVKVKSTKNKVVAPFRSVETDILFGKGIDTYGEIIDLACDFGIMSKKGAWFSYGEQMIGQGRASAANALRDNNDLYETVKKEVLNSMYEEVYQNAGVEENEEREEHEEQAVNPDSQE